MVDVASITAPIRLIRIDQALGASAATSATLGNSLMVINAYVVALEEGIEQYQWPDVLCTWTLAVH